MPELWAGIDAGETHHHCVVIDADGGRLLSRRVSNEETALLALITDVTTLAGPVPVTWAVDLNRGGAALLLALLAKHDQRLLYIPGRTIYHAAASYRGEGKTDGKDAAIIADQARMRRDLQPLVPGDELSADLRVPTSRRTDLVCDRTRHINRLRAQRGEYFPALERAFDYSASKAALVLLTGYQTPAALRRCGESGLETWLRNRKVRNAASVAATAIEAANAQHTTIAGQQPARTWSPGSPMRRSRSTPRSPNSTPSLKTGFVNINTLKSS
ncbi:transposase [Amycolatopsis thermophila]|uniref:Transposase n=1 Tax=Amycolatopsis thermophila TaxID=206084 RepID=A0ABU0F5N3_9PSEU|nr:transposase [Amycolatopsis thermophila]